MLLSAKRSTLVIVDVQERVAPAIHEAGRVLGNLRILLRAARELGVPVLITEHYPKGLGPTVAAILDEAPDAAVIEKISFASVGAPPFLDRLAEGGRDQIVVAGMEAHVCVLQTALGLRMRGHDVFLVADAVSSRVPENVRLAVERMRQNGVSAVSTEMVAFEWLERADTPAFKALIGLIKGKEEA